MKNIAYMVKRFMRGESGVVIMVETLPADDQNLYRRDSTGALPKRVTFRNPLGEIVTSLTPLTHIRAEKYKNGNMYPLSYYKKYGHGDPFP